MKKVLIASILLVGLATGIAFAHNNGWNGGYGGHMMGGGYGGHMMGGGHMMNPGMMGPGMMGGTGGFDNCPGAALGNGTWTNQTHQKFLNDTVELRKELNDTYFAYQEARRNPDTTSEQLKAIEKKLTDLQSTLQDTAAQYR